MKEATISNTQPIGIFDSGVGGLTVLSAIQEQLPNENLIYVADTKHTPYGVRSVEFIESRVQEIAQFLIAQNVKIIVVACNTATAAAIQSLREQYSIPIVGLEPALKPAIESSKNHSVGVIATHATLESEKYRKLRARFQDQATITEKASAYFVELVETAPAIGPAETQLIQKELQPFIDANVDSLVLGCTHFPFLTLTIGEIMGTEVTLFESGLPVAKQVQRCLTDELNQSNKTGWIKYYSSAPENAKPVFDLLLDEPVELEQFE